MPDTKEPVILFRTFTKANHVEIFINEMIQKGYVLVGVRIEPGVGYYVLMKLTQYAVTSIILR